MSSGAREDGPPRTCPRSPNSRARNYLWKTRASWGSMLFVRHCMGWLTRVSKESGMMLFTSAPIHWEYSEMCVNLH